MPLAPYQPQVRTTATPEPGQEMVPQELEELTAEQWALWRHHPVSALVLAFLRDRAGTLEREMLGRWKAGQCRLSDEMEARGRVMELQEVADLSLDAMRTFYGVGAPEAVA